MLQDLNEDQQALEGFMSQISEAGFAARWMQDLEFDLWTSLIEGSRRYGAYTITEIDINQLRSLVDKCGCWIVFDDQNEETAVELETWKKMYHERKSLNI